MTNSQKLSFQLQPTPLDYFRLKEDYFKPHCVVSKEVISLSANEKYIEYPKHFPNLDLDKKETVVFNFPVGKGKTETCYNLIKEYDKLGWYVIVCSPFIKLVQKDTQEILDKIKLPPVKVGTLEVAREKVCTYLDFKNADELIEVGFKFWPKVCNVHIMSINCLLGNPGSNALDQSVIKSSYIDDLLEATDGKKVALFIDELHESIHNFEPSFIANLLRWKGRVQKTYIASATFTPATIPAIKAVSLLTDKNVHIYECERYKNNILADIYLHIIPSNSFGGKFLEIVDEQIQFHKGKKAINILTGLKYQANEIAKKSFKHVIDAERKLGKYPDNDSIHLLTSETELNFENGKNNIGTTFKTGSNITSQNSVLFIVLPTITNNVNNSHYGIFTDGIPSIVQSIGRLRNGGEIHIFTSEPSQSIDQANTTYPTEFLGKLNSNHYSQNAGYDILQGMYRNRLSTLQNEINIIEDAIINPQQPNQSIESRKSEFAIWYPNFHDFLMDKSQKTLVQGYPSFGKYINPYILWACLKDQFQNATLKEIIYHQPNALTINISTSNHCSVFQSVLAPLNNQIKNQSFRTFVNGFSDYLRCSTDEGGNILQNEYFFESSKRGIFSNKLMKEQTGFTKELLEEVIFIKTNKRNSLSKREYILSCLANIQDGGVYHEIKIREAYRKLLELREKFINWFQGKVISKEGNFLIPVKAYQELPEDLFSEAVETFTFLKENDKLVSTDVVSILQKLKGDFTDRNRGKVFKLLEELFINVTDQRVGNKKYSLLSDKNRVKNGCNPFLIRITA